VSERAAHLLQRIVDACGTLDASVLVTATEPVRAALRAADNTYVSGYVRHRALLPHVDVVVCHGGLSTIGAALTCGVPVICLPQQYEQPDNATHVQTMGVGLSLPGDAPAAAIRDAVERALTDETMAAAARAVARSLQAAEPHPAVVELEALLG
jgi:UDP:flavonoid glycosyltransferase YjiC (YdhE family)